MRFVLTAVLSIFVVNVAFAKDTDVEQRGPITDISESRVTVADLSCAITSQTEYKDEDDDAISKDAFQIGTVIKLKCRGDVAKELELKSNDNNNGGGKNDNKGGKKDRDDKSNNGKDKKFTAKLKAAPGVTTQANGKAVFTAEKDNRGKNQLKLSVELKVPIPSSIPPLRSSEEAALLPVTAIISRDGTTFAICTLAFDKVKNSLNAEYKLDLRKNAAAFRQKRGGCDTDLIADGIQSGLPRVSRGDSIVLSSDASGDLLQGTF